MQGVSIRIFWAERAKDDFFKDVSSTVSRVAVSRLSCIMQMQHRAISVFGSAYRRLSISAALQLLCLPSVPTEQLLALLKACSERGVVSAQRALSATQMADAAQSQILVFHA